jgi:hypothetical protein
MYNHRYVSSAERGLHAVANVSEQPVRSGQEHQQTSSRSEPSGCPSMRLSVRGEYAVHELCLSVGLVCLAPASRVFPGLPC